MGDRSSTKIVFGGDVALFRSYGPLIDTIGGAIFGDVREIIAEADFSICNLETPLCGKNGGIEKAGPTICAEPKALRALTEAGVDGVCLANNHIFDFGQEGLSQTLSALRDHDIRHVGAGLDRETAEAALRISIGGKRISIFSFAEHEFNVSDDGQAGAALLDPLLVGPLLLAERAHADALIVCVHGGNEYLSMPRPGLRQICQFLVDMGADAVIGHHPHVPGPYEIYRGKPIIYSLGNLIFDTVRPPTGWDEGYLASLELVFDAKGLEKIGLELIPYRQSVAQGGVQLLQGADRDQFIAWIEAMRDQLENRPSEWLAAWDSFVAGKRVQTFIDLSSPIRFPGLRRLMEFSFLRKFIAPPSRRLHRLNLLRCGSHRELLISALEHHPASSRGKQWISNKMDS